MQHTHKQIEDFNVIGVSYEKADVEVRGKFAFFDDWTLSFSQLARNNGIQHLFVLSTCNRTEIYFFGENVDLMKRLYCEQVSGDLELFNQITFVKRGKEALNHLFRVSTGIESQILGDFEVLAQIKKAFKRFKSYGCSNAFLERFISTAIEISKQIKNETSLSDGATSVSYAAVQYIIQNVEDFGKKRIVLFGTGKIGRNTCENLVKHSGNNKITLINRTQEKAEALSHKLDLKTEPLANIKSVLAKSDILIVATGAAFPTITEDMIPEHPLLILDLSIPENVDKKVAALSNTEVINVDQLSQVINATMASRRAEIPKVETIIRLRMWEFEDWMEQRELVPAIAAFRERMEFLKSYETKHLLKKESTQINDEVSNRLIKKMTNQFAVYLMENAENADDTIALFKDIFHLKISD